MLLANLPFSLRDKEVERAAPASLASAGARRLLGFARATARRAGYAKLRLDVSELAGVLDVS